MEIEALKQEIQQLPEPQRQALFRWMEEEEERAWEAEIERDSSPGGRGAALLEDLRRELAEGKTRPLEEGLAERGRKL